VPGKKKKVNAELK